MIELGMYLMVKQLSQRIDGIHMQQERSVWRNKDRKAIMARQTHKQLDAQ